MSKSLVLTFIACVILFVVGWMYWHSTNIEAPVVSLANVQSRTTPRPTPTPYVYVSDVSATDTSFSAFEADLKVIDANLSNINADSASADAGLKDKSTY